MSNELAKYLNSHRRYKDELAIKKQTKIAKAHGLTDKDKAVKEPHRMSKRHAMDCGRPGCMLCGNPRHLHKDKLTAQEKKLFQDVEAKRDKRSNGSLPEEE